MTIGKLNPHLPALSSRVTFENSPLVPTATMVGDPLRGEPLLYPWTEVRDEGIALCISLGECAFVDRVILTLGEKTALTSAVLKGPTGGILSVLRAETGKTLSSRTLSLEAGAVTDTLSVVLTGDFSDVEITSVALYGFLGEESPVFPTPKEETLGASVPLSRFTTYSADSADGLRAGEILAERFREKNGHVLTKADGTGAIVFLVDASVPANGYGLTVTEDSATVRASDLRGFVMGAETLLKRTDGDKICTGTVSDAPFLPFRGVHLFLPSLAGMEFARRLVRSLISPMGYNCVIIEIATGMEYRSHPEIGEAFLDAQEKIRAGLWPAFPHGSVAEGTILPQDEVRAFVAYVRSFGIEVIPEIQSLGHVPYLTLAHPEIAEIEPPERDHIDTRSEDARPNRFYPHCYCPSNDKSYELLFDLIDEVIAVFTPREYVHMGHDEVYYMGLCPKCKTKPHAELFASDVNRIHAYLASKGLKMMIWSDMLQPVTKYQTPAAVDLIPKDVLCLDFIWYFHLDKDIEDNLLTKDFRVAVGNLYSSHFPRFERRIRKEGMVGGQISTWVPTTETALQQEGKLYDLFMTAEMLWSASYTASCRLVYDRMIARRMPELREALRGVRYPSRNPNAKRTVLLENALDFPPALPLVQTIAAEVNAPLDSIALTHTMLRKRTRLPWKACETVGKYLLRYADGSEEELPITVGGNIAHWNRRANEPLHHKLYRHNGYTAVYETDAEESRTADGEAVTFYRLEHLTKRDTPLVSVALVEDPALDARIVLRRIEGYTL